MTETTPVLSGLRGRCPRCGRGKLFTGYLRIADRCDYCGEHLGHLRADDGPAFFAMLAATVLGVPVGLLLAAWTDLGAGGMVAALSAAVVALCLVLLPLFKGAMIGALWRHGLRGDETQ